MCFLIVLCSCEANEKHVWRDVDIAMIVRWGCLEGRVHSHGYSQGSKLGDSTVSEPASAGSI